MAKRTAPIHGPKSTKGLTVQGKSNKMQGNGAKSSHKADDRMVKPMQMKDRGPGSAFATSFLRGEAVRLKGEQKVPGNLGYKQEIDMSHWTKKGK